MSSSKVKIPVRCILELLDLMERKHSYSSLPVLRSYTTNMNKCGVSVPFSIIATALSLVTYLSMTPRAQWMGALWPGGEHSNQEANSQYSFDLQWLSDPWKQKAPYCLQSHGSFYSSLLRAEFLWSLMKFFFWCHIIRYIIGFVCFLTLRLYLLSMWTRYTEVPFIMKLCPS